jgi:hypothetical protein
MLTACVWEAYSRLQKEGHLMPRFNINFSAAAYQLVGEMATERETTMADLIRDVLGMAAWLDDELRAGHKVLIDSGHGDVKQIVFPHAVRLQKERPRLPAPEPVDKVSGAVSVRR